jgi:hypothetical protein
VRKPFLKIAVRGTDKDHPRKVSLENRRRLDLPPHAAQRILRWLIAVDRRKQRRPLDVRVVVGTARGDADPPDAEAFEHPQDVAGIVERPVELVVSEQHSEAWQRTAAGRLRLADLIRAPLPIRHGLEHR